MSVDSKISTWEDAVIWLRSQPAERQLVLDAFYDDPLIAAAQRYFASEEWQAVSKVLCGRAGRALDVGAGRGIASYALAREGFTVTALEPDRSALVGAGAIRALPTNTKGRTLLPGLQFISYAYLRRSVQSRSSATFRRLGRELWLRGQRGRRAPVWLWPGSP